MRYKWDINGILIGYEWDMNGILTDIMDGYGGFHSHGGTPVAGWQIDFMENPSMIIYELDDN